MSRKSLQNNALLTSGRATRFIRDYSGWLFIIPSFVLFAFFIWEPMVYSIIMSFSKMQGFNVVGFAGLDNFKFVFSDDVFHVALKNTVVYVVLSMLIGYLVPIFLAIIVNEVTHGQRFFKVVVYFPALVPAVASLLMWKYILDPSANGIINGVLSNLGIAPQGFYTVESMTIFWLILTMTWKSAGSTTMIYLASLQGINGEIYEAAELDGAGIIAKFRYITIPGIYNTARLMLIMQIIAVFQIMYEPMVMTGGGPANASLSLMLLSYRYAFEASRPNYASVVGIVVTGILLLLTVIYLKFVKEQDA